MLGKSSLGRVVKCHIAIGVVCVLVFAVTTSAYAEDLPDVNDCSICYDCVADRLYTDGEIPHHRLREEHFQPIDTKQKLTKPVCQRCKGCSHVLEVMHTRERHTQFNTTFKVEGGASPNWLFVAATPRARGGRAVVKVACVPLGKDPQARFPGCFPHLVLRATKIYLTIDRLARECGLEDVVPHVWVEPVNAIIPGLGYHIRWLAVWMELADGISLENLVRLGDPPMHPNHLLDVLQHRLNSTQVVMSAIFDLLTSQCDRHAQNVFVEEGGGLSLIDNERAFFENRECALDSVLLPTTQKFTINVLENAWVNKFRSWGNKLPQCWANPPLLLDYRCAFPNGQMGKAYPPKVSQCLRKLDSLSAEQVFVEYGLPDMNTALALKNRSSDMYNQGFEYALMYGYPRNAAPRRYKFLAPCCHVVHRDTYRCAHDWPCDTSLPLGDPFSGGPWTHDRPDPGTFQGGTAF